MGHNHQLQAAKASRLIIDASGVRDAVQVMARTGSFLKGYQAGASSYVVNGLFPPATLGGAIIEIAPYRKKINGKRTIGADINITI
jgi:hypothetical protein